MCGIVATLGTPSHPALLLEGLRRLEYRGYDSAGLALVDRNHTLHRLRRAGPVAQLQAAVATLPPGPFTAAVAHTRWATHGAATEHNAHPHVDAAGLVAVVHNGIIENAFDLREHLEGLGIPFTSETDTETIAQSIGWRMAAGASLHDACLATLPTLRGTFGLAAISPLEPEKLVIARRGSPIMVAEVAGGWIVASDRAPFAGHAESCLSLHDHELALLEPGSMKVNSPTGGSLARGLVAVGIDLADTTPGSFPNFMAKEIHEQPLAIRRCLAGRLVADQIHSAGMRTIDEAIGTPERIVITGCGSAWHAGLIGAQMIESLAGIPTEVHVASELRHREIPVSPGTLCVAVSQSGETADTLEAMRELARQGATTFGVVNVVASALAQDTDAGMYLHAGPEVGVASTKAFTAQIAALALMAASLSPAGAKRTEFLRSLANLPDAMARAVETETAVRRVAERLAGEENWLFLGRGINWPVALEGALKLKEISYRHAEGLPAAEVKHGPLALVRPGLPVVLVAPSDHTAEKMLGTIAEVKARGAHTVVITDGVEPRLTRGADDVILLPAVHRLLSPLVTTIPLQWLSYHTARILGHDVDRPRNLAKSVTVE